MKSYFIFSLILISNFAVSQNFIRGTVTFEDKTPLQGANIYWKNTQEGTTSDVKGMFKISKSSNASILVISYVGFLTQEITVTDQNNLVINLTFDNTLDEVTLTKVRKSLQKSYITTANTTHMGAGELKKAACCNLSESFDTNPSIDVNFSDAISGSRQIKMLGLTSPYITMTEENVLNMRGAAQYYGLSYIPGPWVESIQITKGAGSVINGFESIAGQINYELLKPSTQEFLFLNTYASTDSRFEINTHVAQKLNDHWATSFLIHGNARTAKNDMNHDHFLDNPLSRQINVMNKWQYGLCGADGLVSEINLRYLRDEKQTGSVHFDPKIHRGGTTYWGSEIFTDKIDVSTKVGYVFPDMDFQSMGFQNAFHYHKQASYFGLNTFDVTQKSYYSNLIFSSIISNTLHKFTTGASFMLDQFQEFVNFADYSRIDTSLGGFFEYTYNNTDNFSYVLGGRIDYHNRMGVFVTPRMHLKYNPWEKSTLRFSAGRGKRLANIFQENQQLFASSRNLEILDAQGSIYGLDPEIAWNYGVSFLQGFQLWKREAEFSIDFYRTDFQNQIVVDLDSSPQQALFYNLDGSSFANSLQVDFTYSPFTHFTARTAYKYYDVQTDYNMGRLTRYLQPKHRYFLNLEYETHLKDNQKQWKFDVTYNLLGKQRLPSTLSNPQEYRLPNEAPAFATVMAQVTRVFSKNFEVYAGGENLGNYRQPTPVLGANNPFGENFDSSMVYGPIFGAMYYAGLRYTIN